ncbi:MAG: hypothetical protein IT486_05890 [Gammaproteobacteria bacterium]|nr:hypothetical protein [Gammaproteobacteria bacterium]
MDKSPQELYAERQRRMQEAMAGRVPDRVPAPFFTADFHARYAGYTLAETVYDGDKLERAVEKVILDFEPDAFEQQHTRNLIGRQLDLIDYQPMEWPGSRIGADDPFQYLDREIMRADEYRELIADPSWFWLTRMLPRTAKNLEALAAFPYPPSLVYTGAAINVAAFGTEEMKRAMDTLHEAGKCALETIARERAFIQRMAGLGFPAHRGGAMLCPFDIIVDFMRGAKGGMLDMMRRPDELLAAIDMILNTFSRRAVDLFRTLPNKVVFIPLHWGIDGFMSPKQFRTFYWPQLRRMIQMVIDAGLTPMPFFEGECTSRLEIIADVPPGTCTYQFENTDLVRARAVFGNTICIRGGMSGSLLIAGSPTEVEEQVKTLVATVGKEGAFILDGSAAGIPREARPANVKAMFDAARAHGVY